MEEAKILIVFIHTRIAQMVFQTPQSLILRIPTQCYFVEVNSWQVVP